MHPYTGLGVLTLSPGQGYIRFETGLPWRRGDEVLPRMCAQLSQHRGTRTIGTSVSRFGRYPRLTSMDPPPMAQLMSTKVILTLLLSFHVFVAYQHAMWQVHFVVL